MTTATRMPRERKRVRLSSQQQDAVVANLPLALSTVKRLFRACPGMAMEDARAIAEDALIRAVASHDPARGKLSTIMGRAVRTEWCLAAAKRVAKGYRSARLRDRQPRISATDCLADTMTSKQSVYDPLDVRRAVDLLSTLPAAQEECIRRHYLNGEEQRAIARDLGISPQAVNYRIQEGLATLRGLMA